MQLNNSYRSPADFAATSAIQAWNSKEMKSNMYKGKKKGVKEAEKKAYRKHREVGM